MRNDRNPRGATPEISLENPFELEQRLVVEADGIELCHVDSAGLEAIVDCM